MLKPSASGQLYIIGEHSHRGTPTELYKIGIVRENEGARSVEERLREHQTGNPRELFVAHCAPAPLVERLETLLHGQFATRRIGGEWFELPDRSLDDVISTAALYISDARVLTPVIQQAAELATVSSNGAVITPEADHLQLHEEILGIRCQLKAADDAMDRLVEQLLAAQQAHQPARPWVHVGLKAPRRTFATKQFAAAHPEIYDRYLVKQEAFTKTFRISSPKGATSDLSDVNPALAETLQLADSLHATTAEGESIHSTYLKVLEMQALLTWRNEFIEVQLRAACGENEGISDICTWKRETVTRARFDTDAFRNDHPDLWESFAPVGEPITAHIPTKDRNYRL